MSAWGVRFVLPCALVAALDGHAQSEPSFGGDVRVHALDRAAHAGALAASPRSSAIVESNLRAQANGVSAQLRLADERFAGGDEHADARVNELYAAGGLPFGDGWQWSAGKRIVAWDVGYAFRPNDVVQQEERRPLLAAVPEGRALLQLEHFGAASAWSLVWVNPHHRHDDAARGGDEHGLALRGYRRFGALDVHGFARAGERTRASIGAALAWVATDALELHASWRFAQRHERWAFEPADGALLQAANPWRPALGGRATQWLVGLNWTHESEIGVVAEAWHDGSALSDAAWNRWAERNAALGAFAATAPPALRGAVAGNRAWQATPWSTPNLRRDNVFVRLTWQNEGWHPALDVLYTPADRGRVVTASLAWQGDRWRIEGGWRRLGGPAGAIYAQLPTRRTAYLSLSHAF